VGVRNQEVLTQGDRLPTWQQRFVDRFYRSRPGWIDGTSEFHRLCESHINRGSAIVEIGAGPSNSTSEFLAKLGAVHGLDVDPVVMSNRFLARADVIADGQYPLASGAADACVSDYVLEHIADPLQHFREIGRILKPGGVYIFRTPNRWHYTALAASVTPHWFHVLVSNRLRRLSAEAHDPYPTYYRANTEHAIKRWSAAAGLKVRELQLIEKEPSYGMISRPLFLLFLLYERAVNATRVARGLRANIFAVLESVEEGDAARF
jgi:SAM-dependent methyltransferase